jgi:type II secretory pathway pseudopilin PulG
VILNRPPIRPRRRRRAGFTLVETIVAMTMVILIMSMATRYFMQQTRMLSQQSGRLEAQQNAQFSLATLDREIRVAGIGVVDAQPILVQAEPRAITFNADLVSRVLADPGAVYIDSDADSSGTLSYQTMAKKQLPLSMSKSYPDTNYFIGAGQPSRAETISFWVARDSTSPDPQEFILFRRINGGDARVVARSLRVTSSDTVFQYFKKDSTGANIPISSGSLPVYHNAAIHGSTLDTGKSALADSIRSVRVRLTAMYRDRNGVRIIRRIDMTIQLMNAGLIRRNSCGEAPIAVSPSATASTDATGSPQVSVTWTKSADEGAGEKDVERYSIFRRRPAGAFSEPLASIPAGQATYTFVDTDVGEPGDQWVYGVTTQDCTPNVSPMGATGTVTVPTPPPA